MWEYVKSLTKDQVYYMHSSSIKLVTLSKKDIKLFWHYLFLTNPYWLLTFIFFLQVFIHGIFNNSLYQLPRYLSQDYCSVVFWVFLLSFLKSNTMLPFLQSSGTSPVIHNFANIAGDTEKSSASAFHPSGMNFMKSCQLKFIQIR